MTPFAIAAPKNTIFMIIPAIEKPLSLGFPIPIAPSAIPTTVIGSPTMGTNQPNDDTIPSIKDAQPLSFDFCTFNTPRIVLIVN